MKRSTRQARRQAHAEAYKQGWDECEAFYAGLLMKGDGFVLDGCESCCGEHRVEGNDDESRDHA